MHWSLCRRRQWRNLPLVGGKVKRGMSSKRALEVNEWIIVEFGRDYFSIQTARRPVMAMMSMTNQSWGNITTHKLMASDGALTKEEAQRLAPPGFRK
jgi:hypothetical protein